jgi:hypothetical protein
MIFSYGPILGNFRCISFDSSRCMVRVEGLQTSSLLFNLEGSETSRKERNMQ